MGQKSLKLFTTEEKYFQNELFRRKYTQEKAMYSSPLSFGQFKLEGRRGGLYTGYPLVKGLRMLGRNS